MIGVYKSGSIFIEIIPDNYGKYTVVRYVAGIEIPEYMYTKRQVKKYIKDLTTPTDEEMAKFLLNHRKGVLHETDCGL